MASGDPLPLDQPAELVGEWWLPGAPNEIASGRLIYQPYEPLRLEAVSAGRLLGTSDSIPWLHGLMVDGRFVTLRNLVIVDWSLSMPGGVLAQAHVGEAFVGMYAASEAELRLHSLEARIANLTAWLDPPGFTVTRSRSIQTRDFGLVGLGRAPGGILTTAWIDVRTEAVPPRRPLQLELEQHGWVRLAARRRLPWEDLRSALGTFREFVSLAAGADSPLLEVKGLATVMREEFGTGRKSRSREPVWVLFRQRRTPEVPATPSDEMMFRQADAAFGIAQMPLDLTRRHPARVEREDLLVEAVEGAGVLGHDPRLEARVTVPGQLDRDRPIDRPQRLRRNAVAPVRLPLRRLAPGRIAEMLLKLGAGRPLDQPTPQLVNQSVRAGQLLRPLIFPEQPIDQLVRDLHLAHHRCSFRAVRRNRSDRGYAAIVPTPPDEPVRYTETRALPGQRAVISLIQAPRVPSVRRSSS